MANHASHGALPYPVKGTRFSVLIPYLDADGDPTAPGTPDTEVSKDNGAAADTAEEVSVTSGMDGMGMITLTGDETNCSMLALNAKSATGPKATLITLSPRVLPVIRSGTAQAGAAGSITLDSNASPLDDFYVGCLVATTGGTGGGGGAGNLGNQCRRITDYSGASKVASVDPPWETTPSGTTTFNILLTEMAMFIMADVRAFSGIAGIASGGRPEVNVSHFGGGAATATGGRPEVNASHWGGSAVGGMPSTPAQVNAEVLDVLNVDTFVEPSAPPAATCTILDRIRWLCTLGRNKITQTATTQTVRNDADSGTIATAPVSEVSGTATRGKFI